MTSWTIVDVIVETSQASQSQCVDSVGSVKSCQASPLLYPSNKIDLSRFLASKVLTLSSVSRLVP